MSNSGYDENDIKKIQEQNVNGYAFFTDLTLGFLISKPFELKFGSASHIMRLVKEKEDNVHAFS
jgi:hypothetical protein